MIDLAKAYSGKRVLVTGSAGFKGKWLCRRLLELGASVGQFDVAHDRSEDVRDLPLVRVWVSRWAPEIVFHLAAQAFVPVGYEQPRDTFETNAIGTVNVLEAIRAYAPQAAVVCVTTDKVYGPTGSLPAIETDALAGRCPYSASKVMAEHAVETYRGSFGLRVATARAGNVIGGGDAGPGRLVPNAIRALREGRPVPVYNPSAVRPWQYVCDVIDGYLMLGAALAEDPETFAGAWNFGPEEHHTVLDVVEELIAAWGSGSWEQVPTDLREVGELRIASSKARRLLGWKPRWSFRMMIEGTVGWYKEHTS